MKDKVKAELQLVKKESSAAPAKPQIKPRGWKPIKPPLVEVSMKPHKKAATPPPTILAEDTHVDIWGCSPTPVTMEYMLDRILTDLPTLSALCLPHQVSTCSLLFFFLVLILSCFFFRTWLDVLCALGTTCFANIRSLWLPVLIVIAGDIAPVGYQLMTCRRSMTTCCHLRKLHTLVSSF